ncbi:hypothetical protein GCM10010156_34370 [Planobispora rosea]|uniref:Uncharacterized protein n=1 Tax=Planobispora rosea TaxID=35762 RepID=A0A8J3RYC8_PLARO|nr:hypothetical protein GCM10010156_34370 [Planobispora rosea]GIH85301.1 hypothetical protein Pro02_37090 [Planobispora rosea]
MPLPAGIRLGSHFSLDVDGMDCFYWIDDGKIQFRFRHHEGYSEEMPDERTETLERIDSPVYPGADPHEGPAFLLAERLTGITMTPWLLEESTYLCGVVPGSR